MCGIAGLHRLGGPEMVREMCARLTHRGPDAAGCYQDAAAGVTLGMRRLKVIDLETGDQPIFNEDRTVAVVYNGEIYNFRDLRRGLEANGHRFTTATDTEVIVHLYEEEGDDCVRRLRGMYAFALWDAPRRRLLLARDHVGIKPLYYWRNGGRLAFASELKALRSCPPIGWRVRPAALSDFMTYLCVPGPHTVFDGIMELPPGHVAVMEDDCLSLTRYWQVRPGSRRLTSPDAWSDRDAGEELLGLAERAVRGTLISDVPLGAFLSGGLDSAFVVALMAEQGPVRTFTIGFDDATYDELDAARTVARHFATDHHDVRLAPPSTDELIRILAQFDEPFADSSALPTWAVSQMARAHVTVALSGDGGDEVFGGYNNYRADALAFWWRRLPRPVREPVRQALDRLAPDGADSMSGLTKLRRIMAMADLTPSMAHVWWLSVFDPDLKHAMVTEGDGAIPAQPATDYASLVGPLDGDDWLNAFMALDLETVLPNDYLKKADRMSMAHSLELRVPLLDVDLVEFAMRLPSRLKVTAMTTKRLLRRVAAPRLPASTVRGRKRGFSIPLSRWLRESWRELVLDTLSTASVREAGYCRPEAVARLVTEHMSGQDCGKLVWVLFCLHVWDRHVRAQAVN